jgi:hypothetical protein
MADIALTDGAVIGSAVDDRSVDFRRVCGTVCLRVEENDESIGASVSRGVSGVDNYSDASVGASVCSVDNDWGCVCRRVSGACIVDDRRRVACSISRVRVRRSDGVRRAHILATDRHVRRPDIEIGGRDVEIGGRDVEIGGRDVEIGGRDVEIGGRDVKIGRWNVEIGRGNVEIGGRDVKIGRRAIEFGGRAIEFGGRAIGRDLGVEFGAIQFGTVEFRASVPLGIAAIAAIAGGGSRGTRPAATDDQRHRAQAS